MNAAALGEHRWGAARGLDMRIPHDHDADPFPGSCPFHGDCWEGLAAGPAIEARWGRPPRELAAEESVWRLEARYVALGLVNVVAVLSPERSCWAAA